MGVDTSMARPEAMLKKLVGVLPMFEEESDERVRREYARKLRSLIAETGGDLPHEVAEFLSRNPDQSRAT
jgi:hypothetical protein